MPIIKKLVKTGGSKAINIPKGWLDYCSQQAGQEIRAVSIEVDGDLTIRPYIPPKARVEEV